MNRHLYLYYLCSNYLTTAKKHRPYWGLGTFTGGGQCPIPPPPLVTALTQYMYSLQNSLAEEDLQFTHLLHTFTHTHTHTPKQFGFFIDRTSFLKKVI